MSSFSKRAAHYGQREADPIAVDCAGQFDGAIVMTGERDKRVPNHGALAGAPCRVGLVAPRNDNRGRGQAVNPARPETHNGRSGGVGGVMRVARGRAVLSTVDMAVFGAMFIEVLGAADGHAGRIAVHMAMTGAVLVTMLTVMIVAVFASVLMTMVVVMSSHSVPPVLASGGPNARQYSDCRRHVI